MQLKRRDVLKCGIASLGASIIPRRSLAAESADLPTRTLGRTGIEVAVLGYGAQSVSDPDLLRYGFDRGVNYIDTADCYMGGRNEKVVGRAVAGIRDRVVVATKVHIARETRMLRSVDRSLASLGVDTVDLMQLHSVTSAGDVTRKDVQEFLTRMKRDGKIRFAAVTTHYNQLEVLEAVVEDGFYDAVLVAVNFRSPPRLLDAIAEAAAAGVGIIAMKTQNGSYQDTRFPDLTPHQASLRFAVEIPGVHLAVPGMLSRKMIDENAAAVRRKGSLADLLLLERYGADLRGRACAFCSDCIAQCRHGTGGIDAVRIVMYAEGYGDDRLARENGARASANIRRCAACSSCTARCSQGIDITAAAKKAVRFV